MILLGLIQVIAKVIENTEIPNLKFDSSRLLYQQSDP